MNKYYYNQNVINENQVYNRKTRASSSHNSTAQTSREGEKIYPFHQTPGNSPKKHSLHSSNHASIDPGQEIINQKELCLLYLRQEKIGQCLELVQNVIDAACEYFQKNSFEFRNIFHEIMQELCDYSIKLMGLSQYEKAVDILMVCYNLTDPQHYYEQIPEKRILVLNNLGCVFRKMGRLGKSRLFLEEAYGLVQKFPYVKYGGITYMNICAVLSQAGAHDIALKYALFGLQECQSSLLQCLSDPQQSSNIQLVTEKVKFTAISLHNVGIEEEYFKNFDKSREYYRQSYTLFEDHGLSLQDPLYLKFKSSYQRSISNSLNRTKNNSLNSSLDKTTNKIQLIKTDRPKSFTTHQNNSNNSNYHNSDGFYFHNNKLVNKKKYNEDMLKTQLMMKINQVANFYEEQNFKKTVKTNNFMGNQGQPERKQQDSSRSSIKDDTSERSRTKMSPNFSRNSSPKRASQQELKKEIKELQLIGILDWSESEKSDEESEQNKNNRIKFMKQMQGKTLDESFNDNQDSISPIKSPRIDNINTPKQEKESSSKISSKQSLKSEKNKTMTPKSNANDSPLSSAMKSNKNLDKSGLSSKRSVGKSKKNSIAASLSTISQRSIFQRQYGEDEELAAIKIQREWKKQNLSKKQKKKLTMKNKKKLIALRQKQMEKSIIIIQKYYRLYQSKSNMSYYKDSKKQKQWNACYKQITKIREEMDMEDSHSRWEYYQNPNNHIYRMVKLQISYNNLASQMKVVAILQEKQKNMHKESYECILKLNEILSNPRIFKQLKCDKKNLYSHNTMKQLANILVSHIYICVIFKIIVLIQILHQTPLGCFEYYFNC